MKERKTCIFLLIIFLWQSVLPHDLHAQSGILPPSDTYRPDRLRKVVIGESILLAATSIGLYFLWYKAFPKSRFHFIRDGREWLQVDKIGHATTAYSIANVHHDLMRWSGLSRTAAINTAVLTSLAYMSVIEVMDGFSRDWGFSGGDFLANVSGAALFAAQQYGWGEQRIGMKFSTHFTPFAKTRPELLGKNHSARIFKDYNGQTYWLSANLRSFMSSNSSFPTWLNLSVGYGAEGMLRATKEMQKQQENASQTKRYRQWYISPDADFYRIQGAGNWTRPFSLIPFVKIPAPAIEINSKRKLNLHPIYY